MKIKRTKFKRCLEMAAMAEKSKQYPDTTMHGWLNHLYYLWDRGHVHYVESVNGNGRKEVVAFCTWIRCDRPEVKELPDRISRGKYLYFILLITKVPGQLWPLYNAVIKKNTDARHVAWHKQRFPNDRVGRLFVHKNTSYESWLQNRVKLIQRILNKEE